MHCDSVLVLFFQRVVGGSESGVELVEVEGFGLEFGYLLGVGVGLVGEGLFEFGEFALFGF
jgi:hypothetical protein